MHARQLIRQLCLKAHPEGGWYRELYRSTTRVAGPQGERCALTGIYYLLERHQASRWHVVGSDETWSFYDGAPLEVYAYDPASQVLTRHLLDRLGEREPVATVPAGVWQAARTLGDYSLAGCHVAPGFEFADFRFVSALEDHERHFAGRLRELSELL
jgi:uncharacterized protein